MRLLVALFAVLTMLAGPVAAAGAKSGCDHARVTPLVAQAIAPCPMHAMAVHGAAVSGARQPTSFHGFSCAQLCAMAGAVAVQPEGSALVADAPSGPVTYDIAGLTVLPTRAPPGFDHPPKAA